MQAYRPLTAVEQLASYLRQEILRGALSGFLPGVHQLVEELGVSQITVVAAVRQLEHEGLVQKQGPGRRSRIVLPVDHSPEGIHLEILCYEESDAKLEHMTELKHRLQEAGHIVNFSPKTLHGMRMDVKRVARYAQGVKTDAWVVMSGSQAMLEWFVARDVPVFALFGRFSDLSVASIAPLKFPSLAEAVRKLVAMGHSRIVLMVREERRKPEPGAIERKFLNLLDELGIRTGPYNLPDWQEDVAGLHHCIDSLFQHTPPTAIIFDEGPLFIAARLHLAQRGIIAPRNVSMLCLDPDPGFAWCAPTVSHISWDSAAVVRRILKWADNVAHGKEDLRKTSIKAKFIEGGTIGKAPVG